MPDAFPILAALLLWAGAPAPAAAKVNLPIPMDVFEVWDTLPMDEKLPYILTDNEWHTLRRDFQAVDVDESNTISRREWFSFQEEFTDERFVEESWFGCVGIDYPDESVDLHDRECRLIKYAVMRGNYDRHGMPYEVNEYEMQEILLIEDMEDRLDNLDEDGILEVLGMELDEEGIIVD